MELVTRRIETKQKRCHSDLQITLEDDMNVPDIKPDIERIIKIDGEIQLNTISSDKDRVMIDGVLSFRVLYFCDNDIQQIHTMQGQIPFEETLNMDGCDATQEIQCHYQLEDCQCSMINSRKISVKGILSLHCNQENSLSLAIGTGLSQDTVLPGEEDSYICPDTVQQKFNTLKITSCLTQKKDLLRIKDETVLPKGKPNCESLLYYDLSTNRLTTKTMEDGVRITGDLLVFVLYLPEDAQQTLEYFEAELPFDTIVTCHSISEDTVIDVAFTPGKKLVEFRPDEDGENRILDVELSLHLDIKCYQDEQFSYLKDAYSTNCNLELTKTLSSIRQLLMKNQSIARLTERFEVDVAPDGISQICNVTGAIRIDEQYITENGIFIEGVVDLTILYMSENSIRPLQVAEQSIPFQHSIEVPDMKDTDEYELQSEIDSIHTILLEQKEIEAKIGLNLCVIVFTESTVEVITSVQENPLDLDELQKIPGLVGYIATDKDTLWDIAKHYRTTVDAIRTLNHLEDDVLHTGDKLLLMKQTEGIL